MHSNNFSEAFAAAKEEIGEKNKIKPTVFRRDYYASQNQLESYNYKENN